MASIDLDWDEASGHLPMVCAFCGRRAVTLVTARQRSYGRAAYFPLPVVRYTSADITLPRCERHRRSWTNMFAAHAARIEPGFVAMHHVSRRFVDAVLDQREDEGYDGPVRPPPSLAWLWVMLSLGGTLALALTFCCVVSALTKPPKTRPTDLHPDIPAGWNRPSDPFPWKGPDGLTTEDIKKEFERRKRSMRPPEVAPPPRPADG